MLILKSIPPWILILLLAILNGALREGVLLKNLSRKAAFTTSGILLMVGILLVAILMVRWIGIRTAPEGLLVGIFWLSLTVLFELSFGLLRRQSMATLLDAYKFQDGNIWPLVLVVVALAPLLASYIRGLISAGGDP